MPLTTLFLDLNSYFASVEQHVNRDLRGKPIAVAPITGDGGCCIAASYEAKAFGVKTGTRVGEAKRLCPKITIVDARPRLYVHMHERIKKAVEAHVPIHKVHSIDEFSCRLDRHQRPPEQAHALALAIKRTIRSHCGVVMRCSIGIAPNRSLAKLGTDMMKPDGLVILNESDLFPDGGKIGHLSAQELAGIGPRMMKRLEYCGVSTIGDLTRKTEKELRDIWGGIWGERWYHILRGAEVHEPATHKGSVGHQHVLAPELRHSEGARSVAYRLLLKAGARLRHKDYKLAARKLTLSLNFVGEFGGNPWEGGSWHETRSLGEGCTDTTSMLQALDDLWALASPLLKTKAPILVSVTLHDLVNEQSQTLPLFPEEMKNNRISIAMDKINQKHGANTLYTANIHNARSHGTGGIAFNYVPNLDVVDSVQSRQRIGADEKHLTDRELLDLIEAGVDRDPNTPPVSLTPVKHEFEKDDYSNDIRDDKDYFGNTQYTDPDFDELPPDDF